jgi:hypothetical protein
MTDPEVLYGLSPGDGYIHTLNTNSGELFNIKFVHNQNTPSSVLNLLLPKVRGMDN